MTLMVFRHFVDFLSLKVAEGCADTPLAYDATMLTMLQNDNISASGKSCTRACNLLDVALSH